jgi:hypothetical protein
MTAWSRLGWLLRWELAQAIRGKATPAAVTLVSLGSAGLVGLGIFALSQWSPFPDTTFDGGFRSDTNNGLAQLLGEHRGGIAFLVVLTWLLLISAAVGPALAAAAIVRERRSGRLDRILTEACRADVVVGAKFLAVLVPLALILLTAVPSVSFAWLIGGVTAGDALADSAVLLATVLLLAALSSLAATVATTEVSALLTSYGLIGILLLGPWVAGLGLTAAGFAAVGNALITVDPLIALVGGQSQFAASLVPLLPPALPPVRIAWTLGKASLPVWTVDVAAYVLLAAAVIWVMTVLLEPLHPLKTRSLRLGRSPQAAR